METITLSVAGMTCDGCERSITNALARVPGVEGVHASHEAGTVVVTVEQRVDRAQLASAIEDAGYDVLPDDDKRLPLIG